MAAKVFRIQGQRKDGTWFTAPGDYLTEWDAKDAARVRCTAWRIVTGSGKVVHQGPQWEVA